MKRYWPAVLCAVSMLGRITMEARAQAQGAEAHVAAAKAVLSHLRTPSLGRPSLLCSGRCALRREKMRGP